MNAYPDTRWVGLRFTFEFVDQEARGDAIPSSSAQDPSSQIRQVLDETEKTTAAYANLEHNRWGLSRSFKILPTTMSGIQTGWVCSVMSNADCRFTANPYLEFGFTEPHSSIGFSLHFDEATGIKPTQFRVQTFSSSGAVISEQLVENHGNTAVVDLLSPDYTRVRFEFIETSRPFSRVRVSEVLFGIIESFDSTSVAEATLDYSVSPIAEALPSRQCVVRIDNSDQRFNLINPHGIYAYLQQPQSFHVSMGIGSSRDSIEYVNMGEFYFATASAADSSLTAEITAYDWFYWMEKGTYSNQATGTWSLREAVVNILANAEIDCPVTIPSAAAGRTLVKVTDEMTNREALRLSLQAACCTAYFDRNGTLVVLDLAQKAPVDTLTSDNMTGPPVVTMEETVNTVRLSTRDPATNEEVVYTASNITAHEMTQVMTVSNSMVHASMGQTVAEWLLRLSQGRLTYSVSGRGNPATVLTDTVTIYDYFGVNRNAVITKQRFHYDGGLAAESEAIALGS